MEAVDLVHNLSGIDTEVVKTWDSPLTTKSDAILSENQKVISQLASYMYSSII